jgi:nucleoid DNA-binding protein
MESLLDSVLDGTASAFDQDEKVVPPTFRAFSIHHREERMMQNPKTEEPAAVSARRTVTFNAVHRLKSKVAIRF